MSRADAIVVLGAALKAPGEPGPAVRRRLAHAVRLFEVGAAPWLVLSGGHVGAPPAEAVVMAEMARAAGVDEHRIVIEDQSRNTFENALYTGRIVRSRGWAQVLIVTDSFHMPRALYIFRKLGLAAEGDPVSNRGGEAGLRWYASWLREVPAFVKCVWLFWIRRHKPLVEAVKGT